MQQEREILFYMRDDVVVARRGFLKGKKKIQ